MSNATGGAESPRKGTRANRPSRVSAIGVGSYASRKTAQYGDGSEVSWEPGYRFVRNGQTFEVVDSGSHEPRPGCTSVHTWHTTKNLDSGEFGTRSPHYQDIPLDAEGE